ncbi:sodium ion-translocating decarboxylase subunit beta [Propionivibrio sp.]|uniref:sodium ion-translocating decarboxylase subunit beta n=1 Tax=Propionivibrio sp. TaxID=2212460 RepID=UPI00272E2821|nr:sodium ion-translocating decarboxylase subunit beta [Propionivibrio sp.]
MTGIFEQFWIMMTTTTGFSQITGGMVMMWAVCAVLFYCAIVKQYEPLLLLPITFGALLANIPTMGVLNEPFVDNLVHVPGGLYYYISQGIHLELFPPIIFLGVGALTDFGPLIANPRTLFLGAAAQLGIFATMFVAVASGVFTPGEGASIGIIGGADGPTSIFTANKLAAHLIGPIAVAAYTYMSLVPLIQPPIMTALTTDAERKIRMKTLRPVGKLERILFAIVVMVIVCLVVPPASPLIAMLMLGNIMRESGVVERLTKASQNEIINIVTIFLGTSVGLTMDAANFLSPKTLMIICIGVIAFAVSTAGGVLLAKLMNKLSPSNPINPLIGSAGVSAVPMAARVSQVVGAKYDKGNFLLMHAMGPNVAGVIGTAVCAGYFISRLG